MKLGFTELLLILIVALFAVGPDRLPAYARKLGEALGQFRKYSAEATKDIRENIVEPLEEAQRPLREAVEPLEELDKSVRSDLKSVQDSFANLGKTKPKPAADKEPAAAAEPLAEDETSAPAPEEPLSEQSKTVEPAAVSPEPLENNAPPEPILSAQPVTEQQ